MASLTPEDTTIVATQTDSSVAEVDSPKGDSAAAAEVPARELEDGTDSSFGDDIGSDLNYGSVSSSIFNYRVENGRTYHAYSDGKYLVPNDEKEQDRMDLVYHAILRMFDGKPFFAPVKNLQRIVDMGTGTGIWALDVGDQFPEAHVVGIDLSPIQPKWVAPNVEFLIDDIEKPWVFEVPYDLVHSRLCSGNAIRSWPRYLSEAYRTLRPGGWVEAQEFDLLPLSDDNSFPPNSAILQWHENFHAGMLKGGCNMHVSASEISDYIEAAGFVNIGVKEVKLPMSPWSSDKKLKEAGAFCMLSMMDDLSGMSLAVFTRLLGWNMLELELFLAQVRKEWKMQSIHGYWPLFAVYGQKPEST